MRTPYPVPRNALDPAIVPGGSSSGSAVAVAHGAVAFSLGTDTAGSGRVPAALNNIVGLKPTLGALSTRGVVPACRTLDTVSVFALTVDDAWTAFRAAAGFDADDPYSRTGAGRRRSARRRRHPTIGVPSRESRRFFGDGAQAAAFEAAVRGAGGARRADRVQIDFAPFYAVAEMLYAGAWVAERHTVVGPLLARDPDAVHPVIRQIVEPAAALTADDAFRGFYRLEALRRELAPVLARVDLLCVPTFPTFVHARRDRGGSDRAERAARDLHQLRQPARALRAGGADAGAGRRAAGQRDAAGARRAATGCSRASGARSSGSGAASLGATGWAVPPAGPVADRRRTRRDRDRGLRRAHVGAAAERRADPARRAVPAGGADGAGLPALCAGRRAAAAAGDGARRRRRGDRGRGLGAAEGGVRRLHRTGAGAARRSGRWSLRDGTRPKGFLCEPAGVVGAEDVTAVGDWRQVVAEVAA